MKRKHAIILAIAAVAIIGGIFGVARIISYVETAEKNMNQLVSLPITDVDLTTVSDGIYEGDYKVSPIAAKVKVTVEDHKILKIDLVKHKNGKGKAAEVIPDKVIRAQTLKVDTVSGATYSSKVILKAIENALTNIDP